MKQLLSTVCFAVAFTVAAIAQEQQDTTQRSNQYRPLPQQDTTEMEPTNQFRRDTLETTEPKLDSAFNQLNQDLEEDEQSIRDDAEQGVERAEQGVNDVNQDAEQAGEEMERQTDQARDSLEQMGNEARQDMSQGGQSGITADDIHVVESKEGPNNEVVYEVDGDLFYVDRKKEELVKVKRSDLKDSRHEVEIKEGTATGDDSKKDNQRSKD